MKVRRLTGMGILFVCALVFEADGVSPYFLKGEWINGEGRARYSGYVTTFANAFSIDPRFVNSLIAVESNYNHKAVSRKGAMGLMQLMPETAKQYGVTDPFDPLQNIFAGIRHLRKLLDHYQGNLDLALAAYNAGMTAVEKYRGIPPYPETRDYVRKVLLLYYGSAKSPGERLYKYEDENGSICITNAVPAGARNVSPIISTKRTNF